MDELIHHVNNFDSGENLKKGTELAKKYDINSFETCSSSRQHRISESLEFAY